MPGNLPILFFLGAWIIPVVFIGMTNRLPPWLPESLREKADVSRLFAYDQRSLAVYEVRFRRSSSTRDEILEETTFFRMHPFGFRTRMQRVLSLAANKAEMLSLAEWLRKQLNAVSPRDPVTQMTFLVFPYQLQDKPQGRYRQPASSEVKPDAVQVLAHYTFTGKAVHE